MEADPDYHHELRAMEARRRQQRALAAQELARAAVVFVRRARRAGHSNLITELLIQEIAQERNISGDRYSLRTVRIEIRAICKAAGELDLIAPRWGR